MRHIRIFAFPISRFNNKVIVVLMFFGKYTSSESFMMRVWVFFILCFKLITMFVVWFLSIVYKEINASGKEVCSRCLEELVTTTATSFLSFLQRFNQCLSSFLGCRQITDVLFCRLFKTKNRSFSNRMETNSARKTSSG
jgi:membrane-associated HD superfamily phosphohydrolase